MKYTFYKKQPNSSYKDKNVQLKKKTNKKPTTTHKFSCPQKKFYVSVDFDDCFRSAAGKLCNVT